MPKNISTPAEKPQNGIKGLKHWRYDLVGPELEQLLLEHPGFYVEIRANVLLVFRPDQHLEPPEAIEHLLAFAGLVGGARG